MADSYREHLHTVGETVPKPTFITKQIIQLEIYAVRHPDQQERQRIESLINHAELSHHVFTPQAYDSGQQTISEDLKRGEPGRDQLRAGDPLSLSIGGHQPAT